MAARTLVLLLAFGCSASPAFAQVPGKTTVTSTYTKPTERPLPLFSPLTPMFNRSAFAGRSAVQALPQGKIVDVPADQPAEETIEPINPDSLTLLRENNRWHLRFGTLLVKDFGHNEAAAQEALRVLREMRPTARGTVGTSPVLMDYWLRDGKPAPVIRQRVSIPFDPAGVVLEKAAGAWFLRYRGLVICNFGLSEADAKRALAIIRKHGFNELGLIGSPEPIMTYLLKVEKDLASRRSVPEMGPHIYARLADRAGLELPGFGLIGEVNRFDPRELEVRRENGEWKLMAGTLELARFAHAERDARAALQVAQDLQFCEKLTIGNSGVVVFLRAGRLPNRLPLGINSQVIHPQSMGVSKLEGVYFLTDHGRPLLGFGESEADAQKALKFVQFFSANRLCQVGSPEHGLRFFANGF